VSISFCRSVLNELPVDYKFFQNKR
jgi:hypothetical protein